MTGDEINRQIAEACGWTDFVTHLEFGLMGVEPGTHGLRTEVPWYSCDLNAMYQAEKALKGYEQIIAYVWHLENRIDWSTDERMMATHATARQRAEAFLRALGKWKEKP
jgi:hypothetical protein